MNLKLLRSHMRCWRLIFVGIIYICSAAACTPPVHADIEVEPVAFGLLSKDEVDGEGNPVLLEQTQEIPMGKGVSFGVQFRAKADARAGGRAKLRLIWHYPPPGLSDPSSATVLRKYEQVWQVNLDQKTTASYLLEQSAELIPGRWRVEIWQENRKLLAQSFYLTEQIP